MPKSPKSRDVAPEHSEEIYRLLVEAVRDYAVFALDRTGRILTWNPGAERIKGYRAEEIIGRHFSTFYSQPDIDRKHPEEELRIATATGRFEEEGWRVRKDGTRFWANVVINKLTDARGNHLGFAKVTRDLTDRKKTEEALRASEERFRLLVTSVQDYEILTLDPEGHVMTWNVGAERIKGYRAEEIIGRHFSAFYPKSDVEDGKPEMELRVAAEEGRFEDEGWRVRKDGTLFWANVIITALRTADGKLQGFSKVTRDLTGKKQAEEALRQSQERYRLMIDSVKDYAIILLDTHGRVTSWNTGAQRITGYSAHEILGSHVSKFYPLEDIRAGRPERELVVAQSQGRFEEEGWRLRKDGSRYWASVIVAPIYDDSKMLRGYSKVTRDLTERRRAEEKLREANESLERKVEERMREITRVAARLEAAVKSRDDFLSIASHELKTPLTSLKLQTQIRKRTLAKEGGDPIPADRLRRMFEDDEKQILRLTRLVDDMLDITRIASGKLTLQPEPVDLRALVLDVVKRFAVQAAAAGCVVEVDAETDVVGRWDSYRLEQVFINLLTNAMKYGAGKPIRVSLSTRDATAVLSVHDEGVGIAPEDQERIFGQFERATSANEVSGLGLGLYIVRQIVAAHGGTIGVTSSPGRGSTFTVELPVSPDARSGLKHGLFVVGDPDQPQV
jgi:PAS domain S-box-containing protein